MCFILETLGFQNLYNQALASFAQPPSRKEEDEVESTARRRWSVGRAAARLGRGRGGKCSGAHHGSMEVLLDGGEGREDERRRRRWKCLAGERRQGGTEVNEGGELADEHQWSKTKPMVAVAGPEDGRGRGVDGGGGAASPASGATAVQGWRRTGKWAESIIGV